MNETAVVGKVAATLPLSLLESIRDHDLPEEVLEDEDVAVSLPRRLGLSPVVLDQIRQYQAAGNGNVSLEELANLIRLVLKRDDASIILREAGRRMAEQYYRSFSSGYVRMLRAMPGGVLARAWQKSARKMMRQMVGAASTVEVTGPPPVVRLKPSPLAMFEPTGVACTLYGAGLERLAELFTGATPYSIETQCCSTGDEFCEWTISGLS
jgi:predicted hydrocarbon binding protein